MHPRTLIMLAAVALPLTGCEGGFGTNNDPQSRATQLAAIAARSDFPATQPSEELHAAAIISQSTGALRLWNFSDRVLTDCRVWINGIYVRRIDAVPAHSFVTVQRWELYDHAGNSLASSPKVAIDRIQLQTDGKLYNIQGPGFDQ